MNNITPELIIEEIKNLIFYSINNPDEERLKFEELHKNILKKYFDAKNIQIDYQAQTIDLHLPMSNKQYTSITFECLDLCGFLQSCLKNDDQSINFYHGLMAENHHEINAA